ncbi:Golgi-associated plant pathogenesis-related protein 1-like isoform X1 [Hippoglossus hippoglossus]|uniref:Golgi-associated plant pathogenesis-related protein 1-like isoform X2 n=1 Tax=Hippoglossus hippoglossus TaxID=8267 RepID=UPI00148D42BB|nr:Golgi-associated plant pathogenesis-related protein 1-like isoform X2 [Hippoglossus hippoglossus]XP_034451770.1 Golgi-associated plant pathogenesis-related protein 1-like isoform X1 [Hippoglossus hippoglossus]
MADESFQKEFLETHNAYRAKHGAPPLTLSSDMNDSSQKWADHLLQLGVFKHSDTKNGENIYNKTGSAAVTGKEAVDAWYGEIKDYNWSSPGFGMKTGHFTQVVWKDTTKLGVGVASVGTKAYVVAQYSPPGNMNMPGYFEKNVLEKGSGQVGKGTGSSPSGGSDKSQRKRCTLL